VAVCTSRYQPPVQFPHFPDFCGVNILKTGFFRVLTGLATELKTTKKKKEATPIFPGPLPSSGRACPGGSHPSGRQTGTSRCPPAFHRLCPSPLRVFHVCVVSCVLSDRGWGSIPQRLWRDGSPSWSVSGRCPPRRGLRVLALQVRSSRPAVPFIPSCPGPLAGRPAGTWRS
jgi:hypothetical protein